MMSCAPAGPCQYKMPPCVSPASPCIDTLIVGGGLAGTLLAFELARAGQRVRIVDSGVETASSHAAGGLMNPLTGPRLSPLPDLMDRCAAARAHYDRLSQQLGHPLVSALPIVRICRDARERERAVGLAHPCRGAWTDSPVASGFTAPFGAFRIDHGWRLDLNALCSAAGRRGNAGVQVDAGAFDWRRVSAQPAPPRWCGQRVGAVVSCEGVAALGNPFWQGLPLQPDGGESLILRMDLDLHEAVSAGVTLVPLGLRRYWLGATHQPGQFSSRTTVAGRTALLRKLATQLAAPSDIEVIGHRAGTRVAAPDREPLLGRHPRWPWLWIFNGLGSRGILRAPEAAEQLAARMTHGAPLANPMDVARYAIRPGAP